MAYEKLTDRTELTTPASTDLVHAVDVSDNGTDAAGNSKKLTIANLMTLAPVQSVNGNAGVVVLDTDDISEGSTNLYYTSSRFLTALQATSVTAHNDVTNAGSGAIITAAERTKLDGIEAGAQVNPATTDNLIEGSTNLYYTDARVSANADVAANTLKNSYPTADATKLAGIETGAEVNPTAAEIKTAYESNADTNAFTDAEQTKLAGIATGAEVNVQSDWNATSGDALILNKPTIPADLVDLGDTPATYGTAGQALVVNATADGTTWATISGSGAVDSVNGQTGVVVLDTDDISEGSTNLYYTDTRVGTYLTTNKIYASYPTTTLTGNTLLTSSHEQKMLVCDSGAGMTLQVPTGLGRDAEILVYQANTGAVTISAGSGVTLRTTSGFDFITAEQYAIIGLKQLGTTEVWVVTGERKPI